MVARLDDAPLPAFSWCVASVGTGGPLTVSVMDPQPVLVRWDLSA